MWLGMRENKNEQVRKNEKKKKLRKDYFPHEIKRSIQ